MSDDEAATRYYLIITEIMVHGSHVSDAELVDRIAAICDLPAPQP